MSNHEMDPGKFKQDMGALAFGSVLNAAARDYKELLVAQGASKQAAPHAVMNMEQLEDDPELQRLHHERLAALKKEAEKRTEMSRKGHGEYNEVGEGDFIAQLTGSKLSVCHFAHKEFERCKIIDKHLKCLCKKYFTTKFFKVDVEKTPFFVTKLKIKVLPAMVFFRDGVAYDRVVGFEELGGKDDFETRVLENRMLAAGVIEPQDQQPDEEAQNEFDAKRSVYSRKLTLGSDDEDSDFD
mmetsp:Transcript_11343/g.41500  ORF Transcript_11343/g.41500 Transcript_11343/m.41500 type:complete len:240 (-) Transcript_11343:137-856(-)